MDASGSRPRDRNQGFYYQLNDLYHEMTDRVSLEQLDQICKALDCDINEILVREEKIDERTRQRMGPAPERRK